MRIGTRINKSVSLTKIAAKKNIDSDRRFCFFNFPFKTRYWFLKWPICLHLYQVMFFTLITSTLDSSCSLVLLHLSAFFCNLSQQVLDWSLVHSCPLNFSWSFQPSHARVRFAIGIDEKLSGNPANSNEPTHS